VGPAPEDENLCYAGKQIFWPLIEYPRKPFLQWWWGGTDKELNTGKKEKVIEGGEDNNSFGFYQIAKGNI